MTKGDVVLVPRIGGGVSFGIITAIKDTIARVDLLQDDVIAVITKVDRLKPVPNHVRVTA